MRIFNSSNSDPMILDSIRHLNILYKELITFIDSEKTNTRIEAIVKGDPEPYSEFLPYMEIVKTAGKLLVQYGKNRGLKISGSPANLKIFIEAFKFNTDEDGNHHHPEFELLNTNEFSTGSLKPFIEADNNYDAHH